MDKKKGRLMRMSSLNILTKASYTKERVAGGVTLHCPYLSVSDVNMLNDHIYAG